jgi:hypothetical protein
VGRCTRGGLPGQLRALAAWLLEREVEEVVMESTAQYWRPVWEALERYWRPQRRTQEGASVNEGLILTLAHPAGQEERFTMRLARKPARMDAR